MKIAQVAPLFESVPPKYYGGTERVVSYLTEELVRQGHDVTLFASGDSRHEGQSWCPFANRRCGWMRTAWTSSPRISSCWKKVFREAHRFDIVHFHIDYLALSRSRDGRASAT